MKGFSGRRSRKFTCHYCGHVQWVASSEPLSQFTCKSKFCEAVNHIDADGNILDYVPPEVSEPIPRHAYMRSFTRSPPPNDSQNPVLCRECQNNILIKQQQLSDYLPSEDDPSYAIYLENLPKFQKSLDEKYPAPCPDCAVKVEQKLKQVNYYVKSAMIGQLLERSENMKVGKGQGRWGIGRLCKLVWWAGRGVGWISMNILIPAWHSLALYYPIPLTNLEHVSFGTWNGCLSGSAFQCYEAATYSTLKLIPLSFLFICWNYQALVLTANPDVKVVGTKEYLKLESLVYGIRLLAWYMLGPGGVQFTSKAFGVTHFCFLVFSIVSTIFTATVLRIEEAPRINLQEDRGSSISPGPSSPIQSPRLTRRALSPTLKHLPPHQPPLFAPTPVKPPVHIPSSFRPREKNVTFQKLSTPCLHPRDEDAMDWNPTTPGQSASDKLWMHPSTEHHTSTGFRTKSKSPASAFSGAVPPAPRNDIYSPPSVTIGQNRQQNRGGKRMRDGFWPGNQSQIPAVATDESSADENESPVKRNYSAIKEPKFLLRDEPTGLEALMIENFKLDDVPAVIKTSSNSTTVARGGNATAVGMNLLVFSFCMLSFFVIPKLLQEEEARDGKDSRQMLASKIVGLLTAASYTLWKLKKTREAQRSTEKWDTNFFLSALESSVAFVLTIYTFALSQSSLDFSKVDLSGKLYFGFVLLRGLYDGFIMFLGPQESTPKLPRRRKTAPTPSTMFLPEKGAPIHQPVNVPFTRQNSQIKADTPASRPISPFGNFQALPRSDQQKTNMFDKRSPFVGSFASGPNVNQRHKNGLAGSTATGGVTSFFSNGESGSFTSRRSMRNIDQNPFKKRGML